MNKRTLAVAALRYLASLKGALPNEADTAWYEQNSKDYAALLKLNKAGLGATERELQQFADELLTPAEAKRVVKRLTRIDELYLIENKKEEEIENSPKYWHGYYSGYEATPTARNLQIMAGIDRRTTKLGNEHTKLIASITMHQASKYGYDVCCVDPEEFKQI